MLANATRRFGLLITLIALGLSAQLQAQDRLFTVQVGLFQEVRLSDFESVANMGFVYGQEVEENIHQVYIGNFSDRAKAVSVVDRLIQRNFRNATLVEQPLSSGTDVAVIQLATQTLGRAIDWPTLQEAGTLYVESNDQLIKIVTGVYRDAAHAQSDLARVRELGFRDAFVKSINNYRLVPVTSFETGIKEPLIPIDLNAGTPAAPTEASNTPSLPGATTRGSVAFGDVVVSDSPTTSTAPPPNTQPRGGTPTTYSPSVATPVALPSIRGNLRRTSALRLQTVLKAAGYYQGSLDGYYGPGTTRSWESAWDNWQVLQKYRTLAAAAAIPSSDFLTWPEVQTLVTVATELSAKPMDLTASAADRARLYAASQPITEAAATRATAWHLTIWENLDAWAAEDLLLQNIATALKASYYQTQVRVEDYFMDRGFNSEQSKQLGTATMMALVGNQLERFL
ncbi:MAG: peptidoglycan-binding domain-containing protein [Bacteroidota bacterium]